MSDTLLRYAILGAPSPLQAGTPATLTLVASNPSSRIVVVDSIVVTLPVGGNAKDLVGDATGIAVTVPEGWTSARSGGEFRLTPDTEGAGEIGRAGIAFVFARVGVNDQPGTAIVTIDEDATQGTRPSNGTAEIALAKFPRQFQVSELTADRLTVDAGGTATLQWAGTPATYRMRYSPGNGAPLDVPVGSAGPYISRPLYRAPNVVFTLVVTVAVPGQDQPLVVQRQLTVDVQALTIDRFDALPAIVPVDGVTRLTWRTSNAVQVAIQPGGLRVDPDGSLYVPVPQTQVFTLIAVDEAGNTATEQRTVTTSASLRVNAERFDYDGKPGGPGRMGRDGLEPFSGAGKGGEGDPGQSGTVRVGLLDVTGTSGIVRGVFARGGAGGPGGVGGPGSFGGGGQSGGRGGDGGPGGDVVVEFDARSGAPGQLVAEVSGGPGGKGGQGGNGNPVGRTGDQGGPGRAGTLTFTSAGASGQAAARRIAPTGSDTLLGYALMDEPGDDGQTTLALSAHGDMAGVESITVPLPVLSKPDGWTAVDSGGATTLTPPAAGSAGGATFTFMPVATRPEITIHETASGQTRTATFAAG